MQEEKTIDAKISKKIFAARLRLVIDLPESSVSRWSNGVSFPDMQKLALLEDNAGISLDFLMKGEGEMWTANNKHGRELANRLLANASYRGNLERMIDMMQSQIEWEQGQQAILSKKMPTLKAAHHLPLQESNVSSPIQKFKSGRIRVYLTPANAGRGFTLDDAPDGEDYRPLYNNNDDIIVVPVSGNSMEPGIMSGDKVYVDTSRVEPRNGETVLCHVDGVNYVKFYFKDADGRTWLASANKEYEAFEINGFNSSKVYGVVIEVARTPTRADMKEYSFPIGQNMFEHY
jgi:phage repressor protein C with HTH and peptisase S24 domain